MGIGTFFIVAGVIVVVLWSGVLPRIDALIARKSRPESFRRSEGWRAFQKTNTKQAVVFGVFLVVLGLLTR